MVTALLDLDPASPDRGFLIKAYQQRLEKDRTRQTIIDLCKKAIARLSDDSIRETVVDLRSNESRRRLYMLSRLSNSTLEKLRALPQGVIRNMGAN